MKSTSQKAHAFMLAYQREQGRPPTLAEVARGIGLARRSSAAYAVRKLVSLGRARIIGGARQSRRFVATENT